MKSEIKKFFKGEVEDDVETLGKYSHDASIFEVRPQVVCYPKDSYDVQHLVAWVADNKKHHPHLSITARCAGTDMSGAAIGESIILDFTRHMNKLIAFSPSPLQGEGRGEVNSTSITVQPGMFYRDFEKITLEKGMILPCYTASKSINAVGGMYGNNSAGERTLKYGKTENYIVSAKVVFADGVEREVKSFPVGMMEKQPEMYRKLYELVKNNEDDITHAKPQVSKNSAGYYLWNLIRRDSANFAALPASGLRQGQNSQSPAYFDLNKVLVGSQGTLGIATEITFRLVPEQKYSKLVAIFMNDLSPLGRLVPEILSQEPETLESYDDKTMKLAVRFFPDFLKNKGLIGMIKFMWSFVPELKMMLGIHGGGFPKLILLAEFAGENEEEAHKKCERLVERIKEFKLKTHITKSKAEADKYWDIRRQSFALLRKHVAGKKTAPFIDDIIVRPEFLPKFIPELNAILSKYDLTYTIAGHAGDGNFHIIPLMDFKREDTGKIIMELSDKVYDLVARYRGSITAEHNDGLVRTPYLGKMYSEKMLRLFAETKKIFDPQYILNPGKKVGTTKQYLAEHISKNI